MIKNYTKKPATTTLAKLMEKPATTTLYLRPVDYNRALIVLRFVELLAKENPELRIEDDKYRDQTALEISLENGSINEGKKSPFVGVFSPAWLHFSLGDNYRYYLEINNNSFMDSSYFRVELIEKDENGKQFMSDRYPQGLNINNLFNGDIWGTSCDIEKNAQNLLKHFKENVEGKAGEIAKERKRVYEYGSRRYHYEYEEFRRTYFEE